MSILPAGSMEPLPQRVSKTWLGLVWAHVAGGPLIDRQSTAQCPPWWSRATWHSPSRWSQWQGLTADDFDALALARGRWESHWRRPRERKATRSGRKADTVRVSDRVWSGRGTPHNALGRAPGRRGVEECLGWSGDTAEGLLDWDGRWKGSSSAGHQLTSG